MFNYGGANSEVPLPIQADSNYFVATVYLCLLPKEITITDITGIHTASCEVFPKISDINPSQQHNNKDEIKASSEAVCGYLMKTVQENGALKMRKFIKRWYYLNAHAATLLISDGPNDSQGLKIEFRTN